jgi:hypothetical protein
VVYVRRKMQGVLLEFFILRRLAVHDGEVNNGEVNNGEVNNAGFSFGGLFHGPKPWYESLQMDGTWVPYHCLRCHMPLA